MMRSEFIKKIKYYSVIAFILPLITINSCLLLYKLLGSIDSYPAYSWYEKKFEVINNAYDVDKHNLYPYSLVNCPKYKHNLYIKNMDNEIFNAPLSHDTIIDPTYPTLNDKSLVDLIKNNKIKSYIYENKSEVLNLSCLKNYKFSYSIINNFSSLEKMLLKAKNENSSGFSKIRNPYLYGEVSISRTARYYPATLIFKPLLILSSIFLFWYWKNNLNLFLKLKNKNILNSFSKSFFYLGILSCIFLILHASLLGLDYDSKLFTKMRRIIIILFIFFEIFAQISLTKILFRFRVNLGEYINPLIIKIKVTFVIAIIGMTLIIFSLLTWGDISTSMKHIFEWNYFSILLIYYLLSRLLWR